MAKENFGSRSTKGNLPKKKITRNVSVSPDFLCSQFARRKSHIGLRIEQNEEGPFVVIEGERKALEFLGKLLVAQAHARDCGFEISPRGPGSALFTKDSNSGLYIHRTPCPHSPGGE